MSLSSTRSLWSYSTVKRSDTWVLLGYHLAVRAHVVRLDTSLLGCTWRQITSFWPVARIRGAICRSWIIWSKSLSHYKMLIWIQWLLPWTEQAQSDHVKKSIGPVYQCVYWCSVTKIDKIRRVYLCIMGGWLFRWAWMHALKKAGNPFVCVCL